MQLTVALLCFKNKPLRNLLFIALLLGVTSCSLFKKKQEVGTDVVARVNDEYLYATDLQHLTRGLKGQDSLDALKSYAQGWVQKRLLLQKAAENIAADDIGITKKVDDYRESLLLYEYEKALIAQKLDTTISPAELQQTYELMKGDYLLESDVMLFFFIKLRKDAPNLDEARKWILKPKGEEDLQKLEGYCRDVAVSYALQPGMWFEKEKALQNFPVSEGDLNGLAASRSFKEFKADEGLLFIKIADVLKKDTPAPLDFVRDKLVRLIIEKRKMQLLEKIYNKVYQDGITSKAVEVYIK